MRRIGGDDLMAVIRRARAACADRIDVVRAEERATAADMEARRVRLWQHVVPRRWAVSAVRLASEASWRREALDYQERWKARADGESGLLTGPPGAGKSVTAAACLLADAKSGLSIAWLDATQIPGMVDGARLGSRPDALVSARDADVLVLDELDSLLDAPWRYWHEVDALVRGRYSDSLSTLAIATTSPRQIAERRGREFARRFSRRLVTHMTGR